MFKNINISLEDLNRQLTAETLLTIRIIFLALNMGVILANSIAIYFYFANSGTAAAPHQYDLLQTMITIEIFIVIAAILAGRFLPAILVKMQDITRDPKNPAASIMNVYTAYMIDRLAIHEAAALFGFVVLYLSVINYVIYQNPIYWLAITPTVLLFICSAVNFPNAERVILFYEKYKN